MKIRLLFTGAIAIVTMSGTLDGKCPKCGIHRIGWGLRNPQYQTCPECGARLKIRNGGRKISKRRFPITMRNLIRGRTSATSPHDRPKYSRTKDE